MTLAFIILRMLMKDDISGYNLVQKIEQETGWKPSYGSLYPTLGSLKKENLVISRISGRKKIYSITPKGKKKLLEFERNKESMVNNAEKNLMVINKCIGDNSSFLKSIFQMIRKGKMPFGQITPEAVQFRNTLMRMSVSGKIDKNSEKVKEILRKATKELDEI